MFRKVVRRLTLGALLVVSLAALAAATGGSAGVTFAFAHATYSHDSSSPTPNPCPGPGVNERHYCLVVTNYDNLKQNGGVEVDVTLQNYDQSTLANPVTHLMWTDTDVDHLANLTFVSSSGPASCSPAVPTSPNVGQVDCNFPNLPGLGSAGGSGSQMPCPVTPVPSGPICSTEKLFFTSTATASSVDFSATADVKESNPQNGANLDRQTIDKATMSFDTNAGAGANEDATVVLPKSGFNKPHLFATLGSASVDCQSFCLSPGSPPFIAQFAASSGATCLLGVSCTGLDLNTDFSGAPPGTFSSANQILWTADVAATNTNIVAVHTYDSVSLTSPAANTLRADGTRFANCDGITFDANFAPGGLSPAPQTYFVINKSTNGTTSTFQVASSAKGKPLTFSGNGPFSGSCIRIIGDNPTETTKACSASNPPKPTDPPAAPKTPPVLCVAKVPNMNGTVRAYLWDDANGHVGY
jgi:hypothetical protein